MTGHSVLQIPVPALEPFVRERTAHYDGDYVSSAPDFVHAHVTALGPWLAQPTPADLERVGAIAEATEEFTVELARVEAFLDGIIHLRPEPAGPPLELTARLVAAFPQCPPYEGRFDVVPHLTLDRCSEEVSVASTRQALRGLLPVIVSLERLDLAWYEPGACRRLASWPFRTPAHAPRR